MTEREIIRLKVTESTNSVALEMGRQGAPAGTVIVAGSQTVGRGRLNRHWISPPDSGLYFSLILRPRLAPENLPRITLAAGLAVCKAVEMECGVPPAIKWPNDLLLEGEKFGGILTETGPIQTESDTHPPLVVIGVGLNLQAPENGFPSEISHRTTSLAEHVNETISAESLMQSSVVLIEREVQRLVQGDFSAVLQEWSQRDAVYGKDLAWVTQQGQIVTGVSLGPDEDGMLRIRDEQGDIHTVISGDINLVGKIDD
jgi:BirA family biotin operon repressor/biotin-[acetyl-CoA-carboxylase] ligase